MFVHSRIEPQVVIAPTENDGHTVADLRCHGVRVVFKIEYDLIHCPLRSRHPSHNPANANNSPSFTSKQNGCLAVLVRWPSRGPTLLLVSTGGLGGYPPRLPQNVACRFPALHSSDVGSQRGSESLQHPVGEMQLRLRLGCSPGYSSRHPWASGCGCSMERPHPDGLRGDSERNPTRILSTVFRPATGSAHRHNSFSA